MTEINTGARERRWTFDVVQEGSAFRWKLVNRDGDLVMTSRVHPTEAAARMAAEYEREQLRLALAAGVGEIKVSECGVPSIGGPPDKVCIYSKGHDGLHSWESKSENHRILREHDTFDYFVDSCEGPTTPLNAAVVERRANSARERVAGVGEEDYKHRSEYLQNQLDKADEQIDFLLLRKKRLELSLRLLENREGYTACCVVCWTFSWEPCDKDDEDSIADPHSTGSYMRCSMCASHRFLLKMNADLVEAKRLIGFMTNEKIAKASAILDKYKADTIIPEERV